MDVALSSDVQAGLAHRLGGDGGWIEDRVGVVEVDEVDRASSKLADVAPLPNGGLAQSMRETATLLVRRAQQAKETGDATQQLRFSGLATLLRAEADLLDWDRRVER